MNIHLCFHLAVRSDSTRSILLLPTMLFHRWRNEEIHMQANSLGENRDAPPLNHPATNHQALPSQISTRAFKIAKQLIYCQVHSQSKPNMYAVPPSFLYVIPFGFLKQLDTSTPSPISPFFSASVFFSFSTSNSWPCWRHLANQCRRIFCRLRHRRRHGPTVVGSTRPPASRMLLPHFWPTWPTFR